MVYLEKELQTATKNFDSSYIIGKGNLVLFLKDV